MGGGFGQKFLLRLQRWRVSSDEEDRLVWAGEKSENFLLKSSVQSFRARRSFEFPNCSHLEFLGAA